MRLARVVSLFAVLLCVSVVLAQEVDDPRARKVDAMFAELNRAPSPGLAVAVVRDGKVILRRGYGLASIEHNVPITPSTVFDTASLAKQFTGMAIAMLVQDGKLALTDDVRKYVPEFPAFGARPVTIDHLLHHTSGLRDWGILSIAGWHPTDDRITFHQLLKMAYAQRTLNFEPGDRYRYSNTGYNVLADVIQRVTGRPLRVWMQEQLFGPLGMTNTRVRDDYREVIPNRAYGYARGPNGTYRTSVNNVTGLGSSSVFSTVDDFARWLINMDQATVGGPAAMALTRTPGTLNDGTTSKYAFGVTVGNYRGLRMVTSAGRWASFNTFDAWFPDQRYGVVVFANGDESIADAQSAVIRITDLYLEDDFPPVAPSAPSAPEAARALPPPLNGYAGLYRAGADSFLRVRLNGGALTANVPGEGSVPLAQQSEREFSIEHEDTSESMLFDRDAAGTVSAVTYRGRRWSRATEEDARPPARLADYAGDYDSEELGTSYRVVKKDGALELQHRRRGTIPLTWQWRDEWSSAVDFYFGSVAFRRDATGRVTGFVVNGDERIRNLAFVKRP
ncbi:MAG TPA: serine hydrolase [Thermoanaerobaculia bacterium]|jgi:CubicO group peptidase (beta-lactamase class C family)